MKAVRPLARAPAAGRRAVCIGDAGTSAMRFLTAPDRVPAMRGRPTPFRGVAAGGARAA